MKKRMLSILLSMCMLISVMPTFASAEEIAANDLATLQSVLDNGATQITAQSLPPMEAVLMLPMVKSWLLQKMALLWSLPQTAP